MADRSPIKQHPGLYRRGERFQFRVTVNGERSWVSVPRGATLQDAVRYRNRVLGLGQAVVKSREQFLPYAERTLARRTLKPRVREGYEASLHKHLKPLHHLRIGDITVDHVRVVVENMNGLSSSTVKNALKVASLVFTTAVAERAVEHNPVAMLPAGELPRTPKKKKTLIDPQQLAAFIQALDGAVKPQVALAAYAGLRQSEVMGLRWEDVSHDALHIHNQMNRDRTLGTLKGRDTEDKSRIVELPIVLRHILNEWRIASPDKTGFVIPNVNHRTFSRRYVAARRKHGLPENLTFHQLRHNYASALIASGADPVYVSRQMGHARPSVTLDVYADMFAAARHGGTAAQAIDRLYGENAS